MFLDFGLISLLLVAAHLFRSRLRILQELYLPASVLAGLIGLVGSQQVLGFLPFHTDVAGAETIGSYPRLLVVVLFATLFMGYRPKNTGLRTMLPNVGDTFFYNLASELGQYGLALLFGLVMLPLLFPDLDRRFALMLPAGFAGGHGTATVIGAELVKAGWEDAVTIGYTFATVGLLVGTFGGVALINIAVRLGWTRLVQSPHDLPDSVRRGFLPPAERAPMGQETVSPIALDPLAWHLALVLSACGVAVLVSEWSKTQLPGLAELPLFVLSMLAGALLQQVLNLAGLGTFVDRHVIMRIGSAASDYLIAFGIASIKLAALRQYALPLAVMCVFGTVYSVAIFWFVGRKVFRDFWFERGLFVYGWNTGVIGTSVTLLRVVDPKLQTRTLEDYGLAYVAIAPIEIALLVALPWLVAREIILVPALVLIGAALACILLSRLTVGWFSQAPQRLCVEEEMVVVQARRDEPQVWS
jgi:ESS family glutamate:Na+ symporter